VHPHGLLHVMSYELMMEGILVPIIHQQLGHTSLATTARSLVHIVPKEFLVAMQGREYDC